jgi:hypothetical protein
MFTLFKFSHAEQNSSKEAWFVRPVGFITPVDDFRDGSLIVDPIAIANAPAMLPKEDVNEEEQMAAAEAMTS